MEKDHNLVTAREGIKVSLRDKVILVTGGTGTIGNAFARLALDRHHPKKVIIYSRDEFKQEQMARRFDSPSIRFFLGDVRDRDRLERALDGVDYVLHAAALKQILAAEYNPAEAIKTNVFGALNIIDACINCDVEKIIALSTDKAVNPLGLYGATKLCSDKLFIASNSYAGRGRTRFSVVRYGNVWNSRGSVVGLFKEKSKTGRVPVTDPEMTRFLITPQQAAQFIIESFSAMEGGEIFIPKMPSVRIVDLAKVIAPDCELDIVGTRPAEKTHEALISTDDARRLIETPNGYTILPTLPFWDADQWAQVENSAFANGKKTYVSNENSDWLSRRDLAKLLESSEFAPTE
jgi:UDP-N-acetylglucosamine 4,6-dehydratase